MTALHLPPPPDDGQISILEVCATTLIGATAWLVRYLCTPEKHTLGYILRRTVTAGLTSALVGMAVKGYFSSESMAFAAAGACGYASPELVDAGLAWIRARGKAKG